MQCKHDQVQESAVAGPRDDASSTVDPVNSTLTLTADYPDRLSIVSSCDSDSGQESIQVGGTTPVCRPQESIQVGGTTPERVYAHELTNTMAYEDESTHGMLKARP